MTRVARVIVPALIAVFGLVACGGEDAEQESSSPEEVLAEAKAQLDEASSWRMTLSTESVPESGNGVLSAEGVGTHDPAWEGEVKVLFNGLTATVPIVAVDGKVHAKLPLTPTWSVINPADYGAPDPTDFMDTESGVSSLLADVDEATKGEQTRDGGQIVTSYSGVLDGAKVATLIPSADEAASYDTVIGINDAGQVATVSITGPFFSGGDDVTYDIRLGSYDEDVKITAP